MLKNTNIRFSNNTHFLRKIGDPRFDLWQPYPLTFHVTFQRHKYKNDKDNFLISVLRNIYIHGKKNHSPYRINVINKSAKKR